MLKYLWLILMIVFLAIEGAAPGLICIWFAFGALMGFVAAILGAGIALQSIVFVLSALAFLLCLRPWAAKYLNNVKSSRTNADAFIDRECIVTEAIDDISGKGQVVVNGKFWSARSDTPEPIPAGTKVRSVRIEGVKLVVRKEKEEA